MKIAIPMSGNKLSQHFGHCRQFAIFEVDKESRQVTGRDLLEPPPHEPGVLPRWLREQGVDTVIGGNMGQRARTILKSHGIELCMGVECREPEELVREYLEGTLVTGAGRCHH